MIVVGMSDHYLIWLSFCPLKIYRVDTTQTHLQLLKEEAVKKVLIL